MNADTYYHTHLLKGLVPFLVLFFSNSFLFSNNADWQLTCPDDIHVQLAPGECDAAVVFDTATWSSTETLIDTLFFPPSGTIFNVGTSQITLAVTTTDGDLEVCMFNIVVEDFQPNVLDCQQNLSLSLNGLCEREFTPAELLDLDSVGCIDNYLAIRLTVDGQVIPPLINAEDYGQPFLAVVQHATNNMQCLTQVTVTNGLPPAISCPADITLDCNTLLLPSITGLPDTSGCFENITLNYSDEMAVTLCTDSIAFQTTRSWESIDPYGNIDVCQQVITGQRADISKVEFPLNYDGTDRMPLVCSPGIALMETTDPVFTGEPTLNGFSADNNQACDISSNFEDLLTNVCGATYEIQRIWTVVNLCDNDDFARDTQYIKVIDNMPPAYELPDTLFASTSTSCFDSLFMPEIEEVVECSSFDVEIKTPWDTLYTNGGWTSIEKEVGAHSIIYTVTDHCGNATIDTTILSIENDMMVTCPQADTIECDLYFSMIAPAIGFKDFETLNELGVPEYHGNCEITFTETDSASIDGCGAGKIFRTLVSDTLGAGICVQEIMVEHVSNFKVLFPADTSICTNPSFINLGEPVLSGVSCENVVINSTDNTIPKGMSGCYTLERTWTVTNACSYNDVNLDDDEELDSLRFMDGGDGIIVYKQVIEVNDTEGPIFTDSCGIPDLYLFPNSCEIVMTVPTPEVEGCGGDVELIFSGDVGGGMGDNVMLVPGGYEMTYTAIDECGKVEICHGDFLVIDSIPPVVQCKQGVVVELMAVNPPMVQVWSSDLIENDSDNCDIQLDHYFLTDTLNQFLTFECCDVGGHQVTLAISDQSGNFSYCNSLIVIQSGFSGCDDCNPDVGGMINTELGMGVNNVNVSIDSPSGLSFEILTDTSGNYLTNLPTGIDVSILPEKNNNHINGVTTFDAVILTRHILNVELLNSPYKIIAADINRSGTVTTFDIVEMRKLILNIYSNFPNNTSWRFVPTDHIFSNPLNPFAEPIPEVININNLSEDITNLDFIGIKIGDLNNSADPRE